MSQIPIAWLINRWYRWYRWYSSSRPKPILTKRTSVGSVVCLEVRKTLIPRCFRCFPDFPMGSMLSLMAYFDVIFSDGNVSKTTGADIGQLWATTLCFSPSTWDVFKYHWDGFWWVNHHTLARDSPVPSCIATGVAVVFNSISNFHQSHIFQCLILCSVLM